MIARSFRLVAPGTEVQRRFSAISMPPHTAAKLEQFSSASSPKDADVKTENVPRPTSRQKAIHGLNSAVPFVGFGMMDNTIMIHAGDLIDQTIGVRFGLPTLMAAASGQIISDFCGVCFGGCIESLAIKLGLPQSGLSMEQLSLPETSLLRTLCSAFGVVVGCSLAMLQMFFLDFTKADRMKAKKEAFPLFRAIAQEAKHLLDCRRVTLYIYSTSLNRTSDEDEKGILLSLGFQLQKPSLEELKCAFELIDTNRNGMVSFHELQAVLERLGYKRTVQQTKDLSSAFEHALIMGGRSYRDVDGEDGLDFLAFSQLVPELLEHHLGTEIAISVGERELLKTAVENGKKGLITNITDHEDWHRKKNGAIPLRWRCLTGVKTQSVLLCPVMDRKSGELIGILEAVNKKQGSFDSTDERVVQALASHVGSMFSQKGMVETISQQFAI